MKRLLWSASSLLFTFVACSAPPIDATLDQAPDRDTTAAKAPTTPAASGAPQATNKCPYDGPPVDVSGFPACRSRGRCIPEGIIPADQRARLAKCDGGFCVPEKIIAAAGNLLPKSCRSIGDGEGRCVSTVFPDIDAQKESLPKDTCDEDERCAPCFDPTNGKETGACRSVSCDAPKEPAKTFGACCEQNGKPKGRCLPVSLIPDDDEKGLEAKECAKGAELCVPEETLAAGWKPAPCSASSILGKYDGVCISTCVKRDFLAKIGTAKGTCDDEHLCAPCKNPLDGKPTGAPGCPP